jgi:hypothetical protein
LSHCRFRYTISRFLRFSFHIFSRLTTLAFISPSSLMPFAHFDLPRHATSRATLPIVRLRMLHFIVFGLILTSLFYFFSFQPFARLPVFCRHFAMPLIIDAPPHADAAMMLPRPFRAAISAMRATRAVCR